MDFVSQGRGHIATFSAAKLYVVPFGDFSFDPLM